MIKKQYYAIKNKEGKFFAGWNAEERQDIFLSSHYYLYDLRVAQSRMKNIHNPKELEIVLSPVQDDSIWEESNRYSDKKK